MAETETAPPKSAEEIVAEEGAALEAKRLTGLAEQAARVPALRGVRDRAKNAAAKAQKDHEASVEAFKVAQKKHRDALHKAAQELAPAEQALAALRLAADPDRALKRRIADVNTKTVQLRADAKDAAARLLGAEQALKDLGDADPKALEEAHLQLAEARAEKTATDKAIAGLADEQKAAEVEWEKAYQALLAKHLPKRGAPAAR